MADNFVCNILKMLIFCFSNHSFLQKWLFFFPVAGTSISLSPSRAVTTLPVSPSYWGKNKPNAPAPGLAARNCRHLCFCRQAELAILWPCYAAMLGPWRGFVQTLEGLQKKHVRGREHVNLPTRYDMQGVLLCSWLAPYPPAPLMKHHLRWLAEKTLSSASPLIKLGVPETVLQPPRTGLRFFFHS